MGRLMDLLRILDEYFEEDSNRLDEHDRRLESLERQINALSNVVPSKSNKDSSKSELAKKVAKEKGFKIIELELGPSLTLRDLDLRSDSFVSMFDWALKGFSSKTFPTIKQVLKAVKTGTANNANPKFNGWARSSDIARALGFEWGTSRYTAINNIVNRLHRNRALDEHPDHRLYRLSQKAELSYDQCREMWELDRIPQSTDRVDRTTNETSTTDAPTQAGEGDAGQEPRQQETVPQGSAQLMLEMGDKPV